MEKLENSLIDFDKQFKEINNLKWMPWIGARYDQTRIVVLGESQYEDGDDWQEENIEATRISISSQFSGKKGKLCTNVERVLLSTENATLNQGNYIWNSVTYWNLVQRLMTSRDGRPDDSDFDIGWKVFFDIPKLSDQIFALSLENPAVGDLAII